MDRTELMPLIENYHRKISKVSMRFKRYLYKKINWDARIICIRGARGVGKTTLLLQHILDNFDNIDDTLYASLDDLWFAEWSLMDLVDWADRQGIKRLYLDEVHRYPNWSQTLKNIYDSYPDMGIAYTSSSLLILDHAKVDLSRRQTSYNLYGMSFREYLEFNDILNEESISLEGLLTDHVKYAMRITQKCKVYKYFEDYLRHGYYPFYNENPKDFEIRLRDTINVVIENDLPSVENMEFETLQKTKKLLMTISKNVPFEPKMSELWKQLKTNNELGLKMLYALDKAQILSLLTSQVKNYKHLYKPEKIFLGNTNLMHVLCLSVDKGNERETFFYSQLGAEHEILYPSKGDFLVDDTFLFEVGGKNKSFDQIADIPSSFLAVDDTDTGYGNRIPLWLFGFLY